MAAENRIKIAVLDDYQGVALALADWSALERAAEVTAFRDHRSDPAAVAQRLEPFDIVCAMRERTSLTRSLLERLPNLKLIVSTGMRNAAIDLAAAKERGILVCGTEGMPPHGTPELTWALILAALRNIPVECASLRNGGWQTSVGGDLAQKTMGIVGLGRIGTRVAAVARAFGMNVLAWSQNLTRETAEQHGARFASKEELFCDSDIVTVHLVLSHRTTGIIGAADLKRMKRTAYFINTSRGPLVDESALIDALKTRAIAGAALDVYDTEPLPASHPFRSLDNVIATGHIGFVTQDTYKVFYNQTVEDIQAWLAGKPVRVMNP